MLYIPIFWWHVVCGMGTSVCAALHYPASTRKRFFTRMGLRSNYINGKVIRYDWRLLTGGWKHRGSRRCGGAQATDASGDGCARWETRVAVSWPAFV